MTEWKSTSTHDHLTVNMVDDDKAVVYIKCIEKIDENLAMVMKIVEHLRGSGIRWIGLVLHGQFRVIPNANLLKQAYRPGQTERTIYCELERFVDFYKKNLVNIVTHGILYAKTDEPDSDGWITVTNKRKNKRNIIHQLKDDVDLISSNWSGM